MNIFVTSSIHTNVIRLICICNRKEELTNFCNVKLYEQEYGI